VRHLSLEVVLELQEAARIYEEQRSGRGARFLARVQATARQIASAPLSFPRETLVLRPMMRRAKVPRFPYAIVYYILRGEPIIVAYVHGKRAPGHWRARLR